MPGPGGNIAPIRHIRTLWCRRAGEAVDFAWLVRDFLIQCTGSLYYFGRDFSHSLKTSLCSSLRGEENHGLQALTSSSNYGYSVDSQFLFGFLSSKKNSCPSLNQSDAKLKPITSWSPALTRAFGSLPVFTLSTAWHFRLFSFLWIGRCDYLGFGVTKLNLEVFWRNENSNFDRRNPWLQGSFEISLQKAKRRRILRIKETKRAKLHEKYVRFDLQLLL